MATDEEKTKIAKLLQNLEVTEVKLSDRCSELVNDFRQKFGQDFDDLEYSLQENNFENPYKVDQNLLEENERKLRQVLNDSKRAKKIVLENVVQTGSDPKRPWRTDSNREKLLRIDSELKRHLERGLELILPLAEGEMKDLIKECQEELEVPFAPTNVAPDRFRATIDAARKSLPNFQYKGVDNSTATQIMGSGQYLARPDTKQCFIRSLSELRNLRLLALEYSHIADGSGRALLALLPVLKRTHFRLQLICREDQIPGKIDPSLGCGGYDIPDTAWRIISIACPDLYVSMTFYRIRDYDNVRRFLTPAIPLREAYLEYGIDLIMPQRQDSDLSCFFRYLAYHYASTLDTLSVHQWRSAVFPLRRIFELMSHIERFSYTGMVEDEVDLKRMLQLISLGDCEKLKHVYISIQDELTKRDYWNEVVNNLKLHYSDIMYLYDIKFCICVYKI